MVAERSHWLACALLVLGCSGRTVDEGAGTSTSTESSTTSVTTTESETSTPLVDCAVVIDDCSSYEHCVASRVVDAYLEGDPGAEYYYCSDILYTLACVEAGCEQQDPIVVICEGGDPQKARGLFEGCIPPGWEPCPISTC